MPNILIFFKKSTYKPRNKNKGTIVLEGISWVPLEQAGVTQEYHALHWGLHRGNFLADCVQLQLSNKFVRKEEKIIAEHYFLIPSETHFHLVEFYIGEFYTQQVILELSLLYWTTVFLVA